MNRDQDFYALCEQVFDAGVEALFEENQKRGVFELPIVGGSYAPTDIENAKQLVRRAMLARPWWELHRPPWSPALPLRYGDIGEMQNDEDPRIGLVGDFAGSLRGTGWEFHLHPSFYDFCCGFIAVRPDFLKFVPGMGLRPKPLPGLNDSLRWEPPKPATGNGRIKTGLVR